MLGPQGHYGWYGDFATWDEAKEKSVGYGAGNILEKVKRSILAVKNDPALFEKDTLLYPLYQYPYNFQTLSGFLYISQLNDNRLRVVDFGGSLGSSYFQHRRMLDHLAELDYRVVEQNHFVETGRKELEDGRLSFHDDLEDCLAAGKPDCVLFSGVLQYLEKPFDRLQEVIRYKVRFIVIDRTPFYVDRPERITIQRIPPEYHDASLPYRIFNYAAFKEQFLPYYSVVMESAGSDDLMVMHDKDWKEEDLRVEKRFILFQLRK